MLNPQDPKIIERYKTLPQPLKDALWAEETIDHIFDVGKAQKLTVSQMGELADIVGLVILGILKPEDFGSEVQRKLNLTMERASAADVIVASLNEKIFAPLRNEILRARTDAEKLSTAAEKISNAAPSSSESPVSPEPSARDGSDVAKEHTTKVASSQPISIFAKNIPEPPRAGGYAGRDPYREPLE